MIYCIDAERELHIINTWKQKLAWFVLFRDAAFSMLTEKYGLNAHHGSEIMIYGYDTIFNQWYRFATWSISITLNTFFFTFYNEIFISVLPKLQNIDPNVELDTVPNKKQEHEVNVGE